MRKLIFLVSALVALAAGGVAFSSDNPNVALANQVRVYGGGVWGPGCFTPDVGFCTSTPRRLAIDAHVAGGGAGTGYGSFEVGVPGDFEVTGNIDCIHVDGNHATLGGIVTLNTLYPYTVGWAFVYYVIDNGAANSTTPDQASYTTIGPNDGAVGDFPTWFPATCPSTPFDLPGFPVGYQDLTGEIVVQH